jgi:hypothetical protein
VTVSQRLGVPVAGLARAMRAAGVTGRVTEAQAKGWASDPGSAPPWLSVLWGERLARGAQQEYRRQQQAEECELRELAAEQAAAAKVQAGRRRFSDGEWLFVQDWAFRAAQDLVRGGPGGVAGEFDRRVLAAVGADAGDHCTWPVHAGGCDGEGAAHCAVRMEQMRAQRRVEALLDSVAKETALRAGGFSPGQAVTTWRGRRAGLVVKVSKVTVKVRMIGGQGGRHTVIEKNLDPRYVQPVPASLPVPPRPGDEVVLRDHGGHTRRAQVVAVDGPLFEAAYVLKSGRWRSGWFDLLALQPMPADAP